MMYYKLASSFKKLIDNPLLNIIVGIVLLWAGLADIAHDFSSGENIGFRTHHGVFIFALHHILKSLAKLFESLSRINR